MGETRDKQQPHVCLQTSGVVETKSIQFAVIKENHPDLKYSGKEGRVHEF